MSAMSTTGRPRPVPRRPAAATAWSRGPGSLPALLALYACWGSSIPAMKLMVDSIPPLAGAGTVFLLGGAVLLGLTLPARPRLDRSELGRAALAGLLLLVGGQGLATVALTQLTASLTAVLVATIPLNIALLGAIAGRQLTRRSAACLLGGFAGVTVVVLTAPAAALGGTAAGLAILAFALLCWAVGSLVGSGGGLPGDIRLSSGVQLVVGGIVLLLLAAPTGQLAPSHWADVSVTSLAAAAFLLAFDSIAGFLLYGHLLRTAPLELVSTYAYATPIFAAVLGFAALGEPFWPGAAVGGTVVLIAVATQVRAASATKP